MLRRPSMSRYVDRRAQVEALRDQEGAGLDRGRAEAGFMTIWIGWLRFSGASTSEITARGQFNQGRGYSSLHLQIL